MARAKIDDQRSQWLDNCWEKLANMDYLMIVGYWLKRVFTWMCDCYDKLLVIQRYNIMSRPHSPTTTQPDHAHYKQLYLQCKHNVAAFMHYVEKQITAVLLHHRQQKEQLQRQINLLQQQLHQNQLPTYSVKHTPMTTRQQTEQQQSTIPSTFIRSNRNSTDRLCRNSTDGLCRNSTDGLFSQQYDDISQQRNRPRHSVERVRKGSSGRYIQKENVQLRLHSKDFQNKATNLIESHQQNSILALRRARKLKEMAESKPAQNVQNVGDLLRSIRNTQHHNHEQTRIITVLTPSMFSSAKTSRSIERRKI